MSPNNQDIRNRLLVARLPSMPQILLKLIELCQADEAGMAELAKLIANDAGMTAKVLSVANSAAYHRGGNKVGLLQALGVLGSDMIKTLVISESVFQTFSGFPHSGSTDLRSFWKHSLTTAVIAREIAKKKWPIRMPKKPIWRACCTMWAVWLYWPRHPTNTASIFSRRTTQAFVPLSSTHFRFPMLTPGPG